MKWLMRHTNYEFGYIRPCTFTHRIRPTKMALSPKSPATLNPVTPPAIPDYYRDVRGVYGGKVMMTMSPLFEKSREPENPTWKGSWTPPVDDEKFCPVGNIEPDMDFKPVFKLLVKEFPQAKWIKYLLHVQVDLSWSNMVSTLLYLRKLQEKGAFKEGLRFEHILAVFMSVLGVNEDYALENYQYARILEHKKDLKNIKFMQVCMSWCEKDFEVDSVPFKELLQLKVKLENSIDYRLVVSEAEYKAVLQEAADLEAAAATGKK